MVSVIVPIYNIEEYLPKCLASLNEQSFYDVEFLLIDDGSTDDSGRIADYYSEDPRFFVYHTDNHGLSSARNLGIEKARGDWLMFVDGDDYVSPDVCKKTLQAAIDNNADLVIFQVCLVKNGKKKKTKVKTTQNGIVDSETAIRYGECYVWNKLYKRELFNDIRYPEGRVHEDIAVTYKIMLAAKRIVMIQDSLYFYVYRKGSISKTHLAKYREDGFVLAIQRADELKKLGFPEETYTQLLWTRAIAFLATENHLEDKIVLQAERVIDSIQGIPKELPIKHRIMLFAWKKNKTLFHFSCLVLGQKDLHIKSKKYLNKMCPAIVKNSARNAFRKCREISYRARVSVTNINNKKAFFCPCCNNSIKAFISGGYQERPDLYNPKRYEQILQGVFCPACGALPRHRILATWCEKQRDYLRKSDILYFAPEYSMTLWMKRNKVSYTTADLFAKADLKLDIQDTGLPDESYDIIIANHVLEHVDDFRIALKEVYRILRINGLFICSFPMDPKIELLDEGSTVITPEECYERYGQRDHLRVFGMKADQFLRNAGFEVEKICGDDYPKEILPVVGPADYDMNILFICIRRSC